LNVNTYRAGWNYGSAGSSLVHDGSKSMAQANGTAAWTVAAWRNGETTTGIRNMRSFCLLALFNQRNVLCAAAYNAVLLSLFCCSNFTVARREKRVYRSRTYDISRAIDARASSRHSAASTGSLAGTCLALAVLSGMTVARNVWRDGIAAIATRCYPSLGDDACVVC
jgi:hypothetical protein